MKIGVNQMLWCPSCGDVFPSEQWIVVDGAFHSGHCAEPMVRVVVNMEKAA